MVGSQLIILIRSVETKTLQINLQVEMLEIAQEVESLEAELVIILPCTPSLFSALLRQQPKDLMM